MVVVAVQGAAGLEADKRATSGPRPGLTGDFHGDIFWQVLQSQNLERAGLAHA